MLEAAALTKRYDPYVGVAAWLESYKQNEFKYAAHPAPVAERITLGLTLMLLPAVVLGGVGLGRLQRFPVV